jgi:6-pyruvoyl tetrahydropterin synthase/QueD family protein
MYAIEKKFSFSAAHLLEGLCKDHPCSVFHGHNYDVIIRIESESLDKHGFIIDFNDLKKFKQTVIDKLFDHSTIITKSYYNNDVNTSSFGKIFVMPEEYTNTTVENMCKHIHTLLISYFKKIKFINFKKIIIKMSETDSSFGEYSEYK